MQPATSPKAVKCLPFQGLRKTNLLHDFGCPTKQTSLITSKLLTPVNSEPSPLRRPPGQVLQVRVASDVIRHLGGAPDGGADDGVGGLGLEGRAVHQPGGAGGLEGPFAGDWDGFLTEGVWGWGGKEKILRS